MKTKPIAAIIVTMLLVGTAFYVFPVKAQNIIKIGVIGPQGWTQYDGMKEGAELARNWINDMGPEGGQGIEIGGTTYTVQLFFANEHAADMRPDLAAAEMLDLITVDEVDVVFGGFRTECVQAVRKVAADRDQIYYICGAATNELIDCGTGTCGACVRCDRPRWKYTFRITPVNNTVLGYNIIGFLKGYVLPFKLAPIYGSPVKTAVICEDLDWTVYLYNLFVNWGGLGPQADIVYDARTPYGTTNFAPYLDAMHDEEVRLVVQIYSAPDSIALMSQMAGHPLKAVAAGIDVLGQSTEFWDWTAEGAQYEAFLCSTGTRSPISTVSVPYTTEQVWDLTFDAYDHAPIYTSWGVYDGIIALHDMLEANTIHPPFNQNAGGKADLLVPIIEATDRNGVLGKFKYTPWHDPFSNEYGASWAQGYVRALWGQWQAGRIEVVWPMDRVYCKQYSLPDKMYPYGTDVNEDTVMTTADISAVNYAFGSSAVPPDAVPHPRWQFAADYDPDWTIDGDDHTPVAFDVVSHVDVHLAYCDETGHKLPGPP